MDHFKKLILTNSLPISRKVHQISFLRVMLFTNKNKQIAVKTVGLLP